MVPIKLVLDTNIVLDWLVFNRAGLEGMRQGILAGRIGVLTHAPAVEELRRVLTYPQCKLDALQQKAVLEIYQAHAATGELPQGFSLENLLLPAQFPRCKDRDDEHFLALAYHAGADALVSKDKAVLRLRKKAARFGLRIVGGPQLIEMTQ
jgi:putative PIN family toxin of toxin-antitoxin system